MEGFWSLGPYLIPIVAILGGITAGIVSSITRGRVREMEIRERIAMIERGMVPPPESDPRPSTAGCTRCRRFSAGTWLPATGAPA